MEGSATRQAKTQALEKFHIAICPKSQEIILAEATELEETDCEVLPKLIKKAPRSVERAAGDGAYDTANCYAAADNMGIDLLTPPRRGAVRWAGNTRWEKRRNEAISEIGGVGGGDEARKLWKILRGYHQRSLVETSYSRFKGAFGGKLFSKRSDSQEVELKCKATILNRMTRMGMPDGVMI
ncbi:MAG: transposase [Chlamydiales bacterium]|nr:transposase [Chlamydiales bacterium]